MSRYYSAVESYYDSDALDFDTRYWNNPTLQRMRQDFREEVKRFRFTDMLEIGYGTGLDLVHFGRTHPGVRVAGIDISGGMHELASGRIVREGLENVRAERGSVENIENLFPGRQFDLVYVFFGALNTVEDLQKASEILYRVTSPGGVLVLSFVNRYYLAGMILETLKLRFRAAFSRLMPEWGGYSPSKQLPSRCYGWRRIRKTFAGFRLLREKGYCILHPAWYYHRISRWLGRYGRLLWKADNLLNRTPARYLGEYLLVIFQKPGNV